MDKATLIGMNYVRELESLGLDSVNLLHAILEILMPAYGD